MKNRQKKLYMGKVVQIVWKGTTKNFVIPSEKYNEDLKLLVLDEFGVDVSRRVGLCTRLESADVFLPLDATLLEAGKEYQLKVYGSSASPKAVVQPKVLPMELVPVSKPMVSSSTHDMEIEGQPMASQGAIQKAQQDFQIKRAKDVHVTQRVNNAWWSGKNLNTTESGYFPTNYVSLGDQKILLSEHLANPHLDPNKPAYSHSKLNTSGTQEDYEDGWYFGGYNNLTIHHMMLSDNSRTQGYKNAVNLLADFIKGKIVMDVGCGSGILTSFCAMAGAKHVYGIDASGIIEHARKIVESNGLSDRVTLMQGKIEEISLPVEKVDVIISEWMGSMLIVESMIHSICWARDKYLAAGGVMMPSSATLSICPLDLTSYMNTYVGFWDDVCGVNMTVLKKDAVTEFFTMPQVTRQVQASEMLTDPHLMFRLDMSTCTDHDLEMNVSQFDLVCLKDGTCHGFGGWFDVRFQHPNKPDFVDLSTDPKHQETHWKQVMFIFDEPVKVKKGMHIKGTTSISRNRYWKRHFQVYIKYQVEDGPTYQKRFALWK